MKISSEDRNQKIKPTQIKKLNNIIIELKIHKRGSTSGLVKQKKELETSKTGNMIFESEGKKE